MRHEEPVGWGISPQELNRAVRIGVQLPEVERHDLSWPEYLALARAAEAAGFDSIWLGDHLLYRGDGDERGPWEAWTLLGALAAATDRVDLGPLVACTAFHPPALIAKMASADLGWNPDSRQRASVWRPRPTATSRAVRARGARSHLVSPKMAAAAAIEGHFVDIREWE